MLVECWQGRGFYYYFIGSAVTVDRKASYMWTKTRRLLNYIQTVMEFGARILFYCNTIYHMLSIVACCLEQSDIVCAKCFTGDSAGLTHVDVPPIALTGIAIHFNRSIFDDNSGLYEVKHFIIRPYGL